ncbi:MAG: XRE family transcriptional regulator [Clostridia bacterium]|nr:XRE family transcriptional regulator [Clostridia bacterium]
MNAIRYYRISANISQVDLAAKLKVRQSTVSMWENGFSLPRIDKLMQLAKIFSCTVDDLLTPSKKDSKEETAC